MAKSTVGGLMGLRSAGGAGTSSSANPHTSTRTSTVANPHTQTSTVANPVGNITVTGGAGKGATNVTIHVPGGVLGQRAKSAGVAKKAQRGK